MHPRSDSARLDDGLDTRPVRLAGVALGATIVAETLAGLIVGGGGRWPEDASTLLLLAASLLAVFAPPVASDSTVRFRVRAAGTALALIAAASIAWWVALWTGAIAWTTRRTLARRQGPWILPTLFALSRAGTLAVALAVGWARPMHGPAFGLATLAGLYAILCFCVARIASTPSSDALEPGRRPIDFLAAGSCALLALPCVPFLPASNLIARGLAFALVLVSGLGFFQLVRRKRSWDDGAIATATRAGFRVLLLFCAAAALLPWTFPSIKASVGLFAGIAASAAAPRVRRMLRERQAGESAPSANLNLGLRQLERAVDDETENSDAEELARAQRELVQVHARLAQAQRNDSDDGERTAQLERRIAKLLKVVQQLEDDLRRVSSLKAVDPGQASIYRNVQGLDDRDDHYEVKAELLGAIFQANLELRRESGQVAPRQSA